MYAGPLLLEDDHIMENVKYLDNSINKINEVVIEDNREMVEKFFQKNKDRIKIYLTLGFTNPPEISARARQCIQYLLKRNAAVITNTKAFQEPHIYGDQYFYSPFLPMDQVCSKVDLMIHHCGSGTYNYQIKHQVCGIALGSKCYDRDEVASQLQSLNALIYIPADYNDDLFYEQFYKAVDILLNKSSREIAEQKMALSLLSLETKRYDAEFNIEKTVQNLF